MQVFGVESVSCGAVGFFDVEAVEETVEVLHIGDIATETDDRGRSKLTETLDVCEAGQGTVGCFGGYGLV